LEKIEWPAKDDIFFSATYSLSFTAVAEVRKLLLACIHKSEENIMTSKDEALYALNLDFFHLGS
jgi:hypothetical protein